MSVENVTFMTAKLFKRT